MSVDTSALGTPLYDPEKDGDAYVPPLDAALRLARKALADKATANIHDHTEMLKAAVTLELRLRALVAALDKEAGR
ncbi:hypothetical protein K388_01906 [Streptomyces sp. KhCrAH-43]|uniref:hypothetical protein n=1 Tax=unclassified Streptomyces TaxID=2593676 RepID=UPI000378D0E3|nr:MULTISPECIES: hypothetical protein [unclassified Streptomyces]MYS34908.1 hypothetical protein [Streptomyces sp. SID4920]MYX65315.1 hypothetical protein [Streptomyces sp. SID8373]RAJ64711.1 hypothetical protein K388_01906 [Streptomyces sp. KhCrAH-43]